MNILFETTWLAPGQLQAADQVRLGAEQYVDEAAFFRAATRTFFPRGNDATEFSFVTHWIFSSAAAAEIFVLTHTEMLPMANTDQGVLQCICGADNPATQQTAYMPNAVLKSARVLRYIGCSVDVEYVLVGPGFQTSVPPNVPLYPNPNEVSIVFRRGIVFATLGATQIVVTFSSSMGGVPGAVTGNIVQPTGSQAIQGRILDDTITANGFTVELGAPTYDTNCGFSYFAVL